MAINDITLTAGMRANLVSLQNTVDLLNRTQTRLSTGKKVNSALDNPVAYFAAQTLNSTANSLSGLKDAMGQAIQTVNAANAGITAITSLIEAAKGIANTAKGTTDTTALSGYQTQFNALETQITQLASDSGYGGTNLLGTTANTLTVNFNASGSSSVTVNGFDASAAGLGITAAANWNVTSTTTLNTDISNLSTAETTLQTNAASLSSSLNVISTRQAFTTSLVNTMTAGADSLTLADLNEEGANMLMLQTRQSLGTTALSLSSQAAQSVLRLFP